MKKLLLIVTLSASLASLVYGQSTNPTPTRFVSGFGFSRLVNPPIQQPGWTNYFDSVNKLGIHDGTAYRYMATEVWVQSQIASLPGSPITSVFGRSGAVTAQTGDYASFYPQLSGTYANPTWITSLSWAKITGAPIVPLQNNYVASGNGSNTTIAIPHGLTGVTANSAVTVGARNPASAGISYVTSDATNINIIYTVAPASGTNNLLYTISIRP